MAAYIVALVSQKGGVGKSTITRGVAREAAAGGMKVKIADLDTQQGTSVEWHRRRLNAKLEPAVSVETFGSAAAALAEADRYDLLLIDAPARTSAGTLEIAKRADLVIQPTGASADDLIPAVREFHALVKAGVPRERLVFALNRLGTETEEADTRAYLAEAGYSVLDGGLYEKPAYRRAQDVGLAVTETQYASLNRKADALIQSIIDRI